MLFIEDLLQRLLTAGEALGKEVTLKVISIYLLIEIAKRPLKGYFQLVLLKKEKTKTHLQLEISHLVSVSRECFDQIFFKHRVQNQQLNLLRVIRSEETIKELED